MMQKEVDMQEFRNALAVKEAELQNALSDSLQNSTCHNRAKNDIENLERHVKEVERRLGFLLVRVYCVYKMFSFISFFGWWISILTCYFL